MDRRTFLRGAGSLIVLLAGGGVWRAWDQGVFRVAQGPAYEPWHDWRGDHGEGPLQLVRAAILASNPHNTQPWLFRVTETQVELYADVRRNLGTFDPYLREMHLGLGCAVENMMLAAAESGYAVDLTLEDSILGSTPGTHEPQRVATLKLIGRDVRGGGNAATGARSNLYDVIAKRHTNRNPYDMDRPLSAAALNSMQRLLDDPDIQIVLFTSPSERAAFGDIVVKATELIIADETMVQDSDRWFRYNWSDVHAYRDGPTLDASGLSPVVAAVAKMLPTASAETNHKHWLNSTRDVQVATAPVFGFITVRDLYDRALALKAGRVWQRLHLWATTQGIAMQPLNQPVEIVDRQRELRQEPVMARALAELIGDTTWRPTFAFRAGYPKRGATASPRRPVAEVVIGGSGGLNDKVS